MIWDDIGFLLSKNRYSENSLIVEIFTKNYGKVSGIVFGGTSKKIRNYLQIGNELYVNYNSKSENKLGYFKIEIQKIYSPIFFDNYQKLFCISSAMQLIKVLTADSQKNLEIYNLINKFYMIFNSDKWIRDYIFWELDLLSIVGYNFEFEKLVDKDVINNKTEYEIKSSNQLKLVPKFLIDKNDSNPNQKSLLDGLKLVSDFLEKNILKPNNLSHPIKRIQFIDTLK